MAPPFFGLGALYILSVTLYITHGSAIFWDGGPLYFKCHLLYDPVTLPILHQTVAVFVKIHKKQALVLPKGQGVLSGT